jgi:hypothetical protein
MNDFVESSSRGYWLSINRLLEMFTFIQQMHRNEARLGEVTYLTSMIQIPFGEASLETFQAQILVFWRSLDALPS